MLFFNNIIIKKEKIIEKWKQKQKQKQKQKNYYSTNDKKLQERSREYYGNLSEDEKTKKIKKKVC